MTTVPGITSEVESGGFRDLVFSLVSREDLPRGGQRLIAGGVHQGVPVELRIELGAKWNAGMIGGDIPSYRGVVLLGSTGPSSNALLKAIDSIYETHLGPQRMASLTEFAAISLKGDPMHLQAGPVKLKLFFESDIEGRYAEFYLNVDSQNSNVYLNEKDPEYRKAIVLALRSRTTSQGAHGGDAGGHPHSGSNPPREPNELRALSAALAFLGVVSLSLAVSLLAFGFPRVGFEMAGGLGGLGIFFGFAALLGSLVAEARAGVGRKARGRRDE